MPTVDVIDLKKKKSARSICSDAVFGAPVNEASAVRSSPALHGGPAARNGTPPRRRHEVSGSGKKLWRQKGTGRARMGSIRSPIWRHGGTVHGPQPRDYSYRLPRKMLLGALRCALSAKLRDGELMVVQEFALPDHKTQNDGGKRFKRLKRRGRCCWSMAEREPRISNSGRAICQGVKFVVTRDVNVYDLLGHDRVFLTRSGGAQVVGGAGVKETAMNDYDIIRRPIVTEKGVGEEGSRTHAVLRSGSWSQQDPDEGGCSEAVQGEGGRRAHGDQRRKTAPPRPVSPAIVRTGRRHTSG